MSVTPWFRAYAAIVDDEKLRLLAFEDRWHFVALCALKCDGMLDRTDDPLLERKIAVKMGVQQRELDEIKRRLIEVGLIDDRFSPLKWEKRQYRHPNNLPEGESLEGFKAYCYFIADESLSFVKIGFSKNPWARVKDFQTGRPEKLSVVATVKTTDNSEIGLHDLFSAERQAGEWFAVSDRIASVIKAIKAKKLKTVDCVVTYVANYVAATVTTTETEADTESELSSSNEDVSSGDDRPPTKSEILEAWAIRMVPQGFPAVKKMNPTRERLLRARLKDCTFDEWQQAFAALERSDFCKGQNDRGWWADFDFILQPKSFTKLIEGAYDH